MAQLQRQGVSQAQMLHTLATLAIPWRGEMSVAFVKMTCGQAVHQSASVSCVRVFRTCSVYFLFLELLLWHCAYINYDNVIRLQWINVLLFYIGNFQHLF